eukprot:CAMPEP_0176328114 /NCGR_PEP_ID=MMETSP0121_2-20121125/74797_1 /TAXON_ID=160619 /ORGANISM="Kryptoperidinium foliaceum, Strain CCMP 1326" /LENGTH=82 /DNA_ID=CAMNT_0017670777 /DNA_START=84 /DNA_END=329 /DNA_ORIENTATION=+
MMPNEETPGSKKTRSSGRRAVHKTSRAFHLKLPAVSHPTDTGYGCPWKSVKRAWASKTDNTAPRSSRGLPHALRVACKQPPS